MINEDEIRAVISAEQLERAIARHRDALTQAIADEYARGLIANPPEQHVTTPAGEAHPGCACETCCARRLAGLMASLRRLDQANGKQARPPTVRRRR